MCMCIYGVCVCIYTYIIYTFICTYIHTLFEYLYIYTYPHIFYNYKHGYIQKLPNIHLTSWLKLPTKRLKTALPAVLSAAMQYAAGTSMFSNLVRLDHFEVWGCLRLTFCWKSTSSKNAKSACVPVICLNVEPRIVYSPYPSRNNLCTYQRLNSQQTYLFSSKNINGLNAARNSG